MEVCHHKTLETKVSRDALRVLDSLDRWDAKFRGIPVERRRHQRVPYRALVTVYVPDFGPESALFRTALDTWARNLSQGGLSFLFPERLQAKHVVISLNPQSDEPTSFRAEILRTRQVSHGLWEHAVVFVERFEHAPKDDDAGFGDDVSAEEPSEWIPATN